MLLFFSVLWLLLSIYCSSKTHIFRVERVTFMKKIIYILMLISVFSCFKDVGEKSLYEESFMDQHKTWTLMIYMNGDSNLSDNLSADIEEMEAADFGDKVNVIVLYNGNSSDDSRLIKINYDQGIASWDSGTFTSSNATRLTTTLEDASGDVDFSPTFDSEIDMLDTETLVSFVNYGKTAFPADHYGLIIWSHSDGYRFTESSEESKSINNGSDFPLMKNSEIATSINTAGGVDVVMFDSCLQGSMETLWALKKYAGNAIDYVVASTYEIPGSGFNYELLFKTFSKTFRRPYDIIGSAIASYGENYKNNSYIVSLVGFDLQQLDVSSNGNGSWIDFFDHINNTDKVNELAIFNNSSLVTQVDVPGGGSDYFRDLLDYVKNTNYTYKSMLISQLDKVILGGWKSGVGYSYKGLSIAPTYGGVKTDYASNDISDDTFWNEFINGN